MVCVENNCTLQDINLADRFSTLKGFVLKMVSVTSEKLLSAMFGLSALCSVFLFLLLTLCIKKTDFYLKFYNFKFHIK